MKEEEISWQDFKKKISQHILNNRGPRLCRGQATSSWKLKTGFHRNPNGIALPDYFSMLPGLADQISTVEKRKLDSSTPEATGKFLTYLQHHGFPTPLLDWSMSPYIAAFFAFEDCKIQNSEFAAIYIFDFLEWIKKWENIYEYDSNVKHVSILAPQTEGNMRQFVQQANYSMFTNVEDIEEHIKTCESSAQFNYLEKFLIPTSERDFILTELAVMNITRYSLFQTTDAFCKMLKDSIFNRKIDGKTAIDNIREKLEL